MDSLTVPPTIAPTPTEAIVATLTAPGRQLEHQEVNC